MSRSALIQREAGEFVNANGFTAWQGFVERGYEVGFYSYEQMAAGAVPADPSTVVVGSVTSVRNALGRLGVDPPMLDYPPSLAEYLGRRVWRTTWGEVRSNVVRQESTGIEPVFVKPVGLDKAFGGYVVASFRDLIRTARWPDEMPLWASECTAFASEWRYFVREGEVVGVGHYKGDPLANPDPSVVRGAVADFAPVAPRACAIDLGVDRSGRTLLVEVNDGFSLGCYGLGPLAYSGFLEARWRELVEDLDDP